MLNSSHDFWNYVRDRVYSISGIWNFTNGISVQGQVITLSSLNPLVFSTDANSTAVSKSYLNNTYPLYTSGDIVYLPSANLKYLKMDNSPIGDWDEQPYNPVS